VVVVAIEYEGTGLRSGTKRMQELKQPRTIVVIFIMLMENAAMNSAEQLA